MDFRTFLSQNDYGFHIYLFSEKERNSESFKKAEKFVLSGGIRNFNIGRYDGCALFIANIIRKIMKYGEDADLSEFEWKD